MTRMYQSLLVLAVLMLMILGLNTSNQGINSLTLDAAKPVLGWYNQGDNLHIFTLGQTHSYDKREAREDVKEVWQQAKMGAQNSYNQLGHTINNIKMLYKSSF